MNEILINEGPTRISVDCTDDGKIVGSDVSIFPFLKTQLIEYDHDHNTNEYVVRYRYFRRENNRLILPLQIKNELKAFFGHRNLRGIIVKYSIPGTDVQYEVGDTYTDRDHQTEMIKFLSSGDHMRTLEMQTGKGKTYCAIKAIANICKRTLIVVPASLQEQWINSLYAILNIRPNTIYKASGSKSLEALMMPDCKPDIVIASITTLANHISNQDEHDDYVKLSEIFQSCDFGLKIIDECHINFNANCMVDLSLDIAENIYLSATYMRSDRSSNAVFRRIFPDAIRYGVQKYDKYVDITEYEYSLGTIPVSKISTPKGYSHIKFEKFVLKKTNVKLTYFSHIVRLVRTHYISIRKPKQKLLILIATKAMAYELSDFLKSTFPEDRDTIFPFLGEHTDDVLENSSIIVSTIGSSGTGKDIKGLRSVILTVSFGSESLTYQTLGRLRKLPEDTPELVYMVNSYIQSHQYHAANRRAIYLKVAKMFYTSKLS